jgi:hypothetical protein
MDKIFRQKAERPAGADQFRKSQSVCIVVS